MEEGRGREGSKVEEEIRKAKLREVKRMKEELEEKLAMLNENVGLLASGSSPSLGTTANPLSKKEKEDRSKLRADLEVRRKEAADFIHKLKKEKKQRDHREAEQRRLAEEKRRKEAEEAQRRMQERENEMLKKRGEEREAFKQQREQALKKKAEPPPKPMLKPADSYLYKRREEEFNREVNLSTLEKRKQDLAQKRNIYKSVTKAELQEHLNKYQAQIAEKEEQRLRDLKEKQKQEQSVYSALTKLKTKGIDKVKQDEQAAREEAERRKHEHKYLRDKMASYSTLVKETCPVNADPRKAAELQELIKSLKNPVRQPQDPRTIRERYAIAALNPRRLQSKPGTHSTSAARLPEEKPGQTLDLPSVDGPRAGPEVGGNSTTKAKRALKIAINQLEPQKPAIAKAKSPDYLAELRKKRAENYVTSKSVRFDWQADLQDNRLNRAEKYNRLVDKANQIETRARMKEQLLQAKGGSDKNPEMGEYVSEMFIDAIKAKLAVLENI
jgi:hypothetical protein